MRCKVPEHATLFCRRRPQEAQWKLLLLCVDTSFLHSRMQVSAVGRAERAVKMLPLRYALLPALFGLFSAPRGEREIARTLGRRLAPLDLARLRLRITRKT